MAGHPRSTTGRRPPPERGRAAAGRPGGVHGLGGLGGLGGLAVLTVMLSALGSAGPSFAAGPSLAGGPPIEPATSPYPPSPEATRFFERLVDRYRAIVHYADTFLLEQVIGSTDGDDRATTRTKVAARSRVDGDRLEVETDTDRLWSMLAGGADREPADGPDKANEAVRRERDLAIAPHLRLRFLDDPLREFKSADDEAFRATGIAPVRHEDRDMVRIELRSGGESPGSASSVIGITVDPGSMLIRKVDGEEQWSDGRNRTTTISIEPEDAEVDPVVPAISEPESSDPPVATPSGPEGPASTVGLG